MLQRFLICIVAILFSVGAQGRSVKIFVLASYSPKDHFEKSEIKGLESSLRENFINYKLQVLWINSRGNSLQELKKAKKAIVDKVREFEPSVIVALNDAALEVVLENFVGNGPPWIVFFGVNMLIKDYNSRYHFLRGVTPVKNVTGVLEKIFTLENLELLNGWWLKDDYKVILIYSTDPMSLIVAEQVRRELKGSPFSRHIKYYQIETLNQLKSLIATLNRDPAVRAIFPFMLSLKDPSNNRIVATTDLIPMLSKFTCIPLIMPHIEAVKDGTWGGVVLDYYRMGREAGMMVVKLLEGMPIGEIPVSETKDFMIVFNIRRIRECGLPVPDYLLNLADSIEGVSE